MLVVHEIPGTDFNVIPYPDNATFFAELNWSISTLPVATLTNASASPVSLANLTSTWGPKRDPLYVVVPITVIYAVILLTGLVGNVSTCVVIARNSHMQTATNYYLFSLAVSDLLLLVSGLPQEMYYNWSRYPYIFGEAFCVLQGFAAETSANATVLTITAFTVERYVAICHPFQSHTLSKLSRAVRLILLIWLLAMGLAVPQALQFGVVYEQLPGGQVLDAEHTVCAVKRVVIPHSFEVSSLLFFVAPMTLISVLYALIGLQLRRSSLRSRGGSVRLRTGVGRRSPQQMAQDGRKNFSKNAQIKATKHVVKMLVAVVVAFFICWAPFHAQRLLAVYASGSNDERPSASMIIVYHTLTYTSGVLYYLSTTVNPVLYHIMSYKFREAFKDTLARYLGRRRPRRGRWQCYSILSARHSNTSNASSLRRYLDADMARLHTSQRPVVVSFRRYHTQQQDTTGDTEISGGSTSTGPEVYISLEELTRNLSRNTSRKSSKLKKNRDRLNDTYLSVSCKRPKSTAKDARDKNAKEETDKEDACSGFPSPANSYFPYSPKHDNQSQDFMVPSAFTDNESNALHLTGINVETSKENSLTKNNTEKILDNDTELSGAFKERMKYPKVEDIEIFQEQHLKIQIPLKKKHVRSRHNRHQSKAPNALTSSYNTTEYYHRESRDRLRIKSDEIQNDRIHEGPHCTVLRSSTLPSFQTATKDTETCFSDTEAKAEDLSRAPFRQNTCDFQSDDKSAGEEQNVRLSRQFSETVSHNRCKSPDVLRGNTIFKPKSYVIQDKNESDLTDTPTKIGHTRVHNIQNNVLNSNVPDGVQSPLDKETSLLVKEDKIQRETNTILHVHKGVINEQDTSLVSENGTLQPQNMATVIVRGCDVLDTAQLCCETTVKED